MRRLLALLPGMVVAAVVAASAAQAPTSPAPATPPPATPVPAAPTDGAVQGPTFRTGIDMISVDVGVVDRQGRPVEDLHAPEFVVKVDGEVRRVVSAELVRVDVEAARKQKTADRFESESFYTSNLTPPQGRQIVIAVDQVSIRPGALRPILTAAKNFLDKLSPLDQVSFIAYPEPGPRVGFTADHGRIKAAMDGIVGAMVTMSDGQYNIGVSEAMLITDRLDQMALATVVSRECTTTEPERRYACERDIAAQAAQITRRVHQSAEESLIGLRDLLERLAYVDGPKSLILISEGLAVENPSDLDVVVRMAGRARTSINVLVVDLQRGDISIAQRPATESADRRIRTQGLESLASMSRGSLFQIVGSGETVFTRLASEISAYYLLGVEQYPGDQSSERHRIDVEVRRRDVTIRSRQAFVLSPTLGPKRTTQENLVDALMSPFAVSGVPLRVTTFSRQDPASDKVQLTIAAQVGTPGAKPEDVTVAYMLIDREGKVTADYLEKRTLAPATASPNEPLSFVGGAEVEPGVYTLRFGVIDAEGRRGSLMRDVSAWKMRDEEFAMGDLVVGNFPEGGERLRAAVEPRVTADNLAMYLELYSTSAATWETSSVAFDVAEDDHSPALATLPAQMAPGGQPSWRIASGVLRARMLPPGRYVARAQISRAGKVVGLLARPFVVEQIGEASKMMPVAAMSAAAASFAGSLPKFQRDVTLARDLVGTMLDMLQKRSPLLGDAMTEARAGRYGPAALEALTAGDQTAAALLRGIDLYAKGQIDQAATQLSLAAGPRRDFFPAAFYLGAAFAAGGRDREAAGIWQMALGAEVRPTAVYLMVADARLRDGQPASAIDVLTPVFARDPSADVARRLGIALMLTNRYDDAVPVLDAFLEREPADQDMLLAAVVAHYERARGGAALSNVDRAKLKKYGTAYTGTALPLVLKYLDTLQVK